MREILFRGKRLDNEGWVYGYLVRQPSAVQIGDYSNPWYIHVPPRDPDDSGGVYNVSPATVGQYTGLTDKDGNKRTSAEVVADHVYFGDNNRDKKERPIDWDAPGTHKGWDAVDECFARDMYGIEPGDYSAPVDGYPAQSDPDSDFAELTTDDGNLPF